MQMGKLKFTFTNILFWVAIVTSILVFENISFFTYDQTTDFMSFNLNDTYFFLLFSIAAICYLAMFIYETILNKAKANVPLLIMCVMLLLCGTIGIYSFTSMSFQVAPTYTVDDFHKLKHVLSFTLFVCSIYSTIFYFTKNHPSLSRLKYIFIIVILMTYFFVIYSIVTEYSMYELLFNAQTAEEAFSVSIKSLFLNPNMFSGFLLMGICASMALNTYKKNPLSYISIIGFSIIEFFVCSMTGVIICLVAVFLYFLVEIIASFKRKQKGSLLKLGFMLGGYIVVVLLFILSQSYDVRGVSSICRFIYHQFQSTDFETFTHRTYIWSEAMKLLFKDPITTMFGYGFRNSEYLVGHAVNAVNYKLSCHNGYVQTMLNFGLVGFGMLMAFFVYYFYSLIRLMRKYTRFALVYLVIGVAYFAQAFTESFIAFAPGAQGILIGALFYLPVINKNTHLRRKEVVDYAVNEVGTLELLKPKYMVRGATRFILSLMTVVAALFVFDMYREDEGIRYLLCNIIGGLGIYLLFFPYLNGLFATKSSVNKYIVNLSIFTLANLVVVGSLVTTYFFLKPILFEGFVWLIPGAMGFVLLLYILIFAPTKKGGFKLYLNTFVGFKTSLGSLIGMSAFTIALQHSQPYIDMNYVVFIILVLIAGLVVFYTFTFLVPFKDTRDIVAYVCSYDVDIMKREVVKDKLGVYSNAY